MSSSIRIPQKKSKGRQKVEMVKMENDSNLQVTFSKRRAGLFKKASELCTLCAAEATIVVFSPAQKAYCFSHPNVENVANRFLNGVSSEQTNSLNKLIIEAQRNSNIRNLNLELTQLETLIGMEKKRGEELDQVKKLVHPNSFGELNITQLGCLKEAVLELKKNFDVEVQKSMLRLSNPHPYQSIGGEIENGGNPNVFTFDVGPNFCGNVPTFNNPMQIGSTNDLSSYPNYDPYIFGAHHMPNYYDPNATSSSNAPFSYDPNPTTFSSLFDGYNLVTNGSNNAMSMANGSNIYPSSLMNTVDPTAVANGYFNMPGGGGGGFNINGYGNRLF